MEHAQSKYSKLKGVFWGWGVGLLTGIVVPLWAAQYPDFFNHNRWLLPVCLFVMTSGFVVPLFLHGRAIGLYLWFFSLRFWGRVRVSLLLAVMLCSAGKGIVWLYHFHVAHLQSILANERGKASGTADSTKVPEPKITVRVASETLPIRVAPFDEVFVLQVKPDITGWLYTETNNTDKAIFWPTDLTHKQNDPIEPIIDCQITNDDDRNLSSVRLDFDLNFYRLVNVPATRVIKNGITSISIPAVHDHATFSYVDKKTKQLLGGMDGDLVSNVSHWVELPLIKAGSTEKIYLVSQTNELVSKIAFPVTGTALMQGYSEPLKLQIVRAQVNREDSMPWFPLQPSQHDWKHSWN